MTRAGVAGELIALLWDNSIVKLSERGQRPVSSLGQRRHPSESRVSQPESENLGGLSQGPVSAHLAATGPSQFINKTFSDVSGAETFCFETLFVHSPELTQLSLSTVTTQKTRNCFNVTFILSQERLQCNAMNTFHCSLSLEKNMISRPVIFSVE